MNHIKPPANKKKRLYKMAKHLGNPQERWWLVAPEILSESAWITQVGKLMGTATQGFTEEGIRAWVDGLYGAGQRDRRPHWLSVYQRVYVPLVNAAIQSAMKSGFGFKGISSVHVGSRNFPVWTDCFIAPSGLAVFLETKRSAPVAGGFPKVLRSAFRPAPSVDIPPWCMADYYRTRSQQYAERFGWDLSDVDPGWQRGERTVPPMEQIREVVTSGEDVVGLGLMGFVLDLSNDI